MGYDGFAASYKTLGVDTLVIVKQYLLARKDVVQVVLERSFKKIWFRWID
jgi:hypothetical protein